MKLVVVGGVAGGASAVTRARRLSEDAEIVLIERGPDVSFANCGMPYYIGGVITDRSKLLVTTPQRLRERFRLDVRTQSTVLRINRSQKTVQVQELPSGRTYEESYDRLLLAPGAAPIIPPLPGIQLPSVYTLRNLQDADRILAHVAQSNAQRVAVVGGGFIGLEMVENFIHQHKQVTLIESQDQVLPPLDREMTVPLNAVLKQRGVRLLLENAVESFEQVESGISLALRSGESVIVDLAIVGVGVRPESGLASEAGLAVGPRGGIQVNRHLQTTDPDIYAVGDAIEVEDFVLKQPTQVPLAGPANRQGRIAADHIFGRPSTFRGTQATAILGLFGLTAATTGASEKTLVRSGRPYVSAVVHPGNHAGYYPGAESMTLKAMFDPESGLLLGAQAVGGSGVDKRIDVLAIAIQAGLTAFDLEEVELAYAPQFGSAKDPINMLGFVAAGMLRGDHPQLSVAALKAIPTDAQPQLVDVRSVQEFEGGHLPGAVNIPVDELRERLGEIDAARQCVVYCQVGQRGYLATRILLQLGFDVRNLSGGYKSYAMLLGL